LAGCKPEFAPPAAGPAGGARMRPGPEGTAPGTHQGFN